MNFNSPVCLFEDAQEADQPEKKDNDILQGICHLSSSTYIYMSLTMWSKIPLEVKMLMVDSQAQRVVLPTVGKAR